MFSSLAFGGNVICLIILATVPTNENPQLILTLVTFTVCNSIGIVFLQHDFLENLFETFTFSHFKKLYSDINCTPSFNILLPKSIMI